MCDALDRQVDYNERVLINWENELPADDPIFGKTHFVFYAGPELSVHELAALSRGEEPKADEDEST